MIIIDNKEVDVTFRKSSSVNYNMYTIIFQHNYSRNYFVVQVEDISENNNYYRFQFEFENCSYYGEYTYYIIPYYQYFNLIIDSNNIKNSIIYDLNNCNIILANNQLLLVNNGELIINDPDNCTDYLQGTKIDIIQKGLLRYKKEKEIKQYENKRTFDVYDQKIYETTLDIVNNNINIHNFNDKLVNSEYNGCE